MKILFVSHSSVVTSYQQKLCELSKYPEVEVHLLIPDRWYEGNKLVRASGSHCPEITVHTERVHLVGRIGGHFYNPGVLMELARTISPDIIHIEEEPWSVACWQAVRAAAAIGAKVVVFTWENIWRGYRWPSEKILKYTLRKATHMIAGNEEGKSVLVRRGFCRGISVLPQYGVGENLFRSRDAGQLKAPLGISSPTVGYIGRLDVEKGVDLVLQALARINSRVNGFVAGEGPERKNLIALAHQLGIEGRVIFHEGIPQEEMPEYLSCLDVLVLPSKTTPHWKEQFGRILVEAMACEVPVIGSRCGEIPRTIGDAGLTFREGDSDELTRKIQSVLENDALRDTLRKKGRARVLENYTNRRLASSLYTLHRSLLSPE
jgi:glycosyltransferase involved in cell wall biosynthesis